MAKKNIILTGFMGTGKTTVGRHLAARLVYVFVDTDDLIMGRDGRSINDIFREDGEDAFRRWESIVSKELARRQGLVVATGGRLMLDPENAATLGRDAHVFCLTAEPEEIIARLAEDGGKRPLLDVADPVERIKVLLAQRAAKYARFTQISSSGKTAEQIAEEIVQCISVQKRSISIDE
jgi:shikimate kinase